MQNKDKNLTSLDHLSELLTSISYYDKTTIELNLNCSTINSGGIKQLDTTDSLSLIKLANLGLDTLKNSTASFKELHTITTAKQKTTTISIPIQSIRHSCFKTIRPSEECSELANDLDAVLFVNDEDAEDINGNIEYAEPTITTRKRMLSCNLLIDAIQYLKNNDIDITFDDDEFPYCNGILINDSYLVNVEVLNRTTLLKTISRINLILEVPNEDALLLKTDLDVVAQRGLDVHIKTKIYNRKQKHPITIECTFDISKRKQQ